MERNKSRLIIVSNRLPLKKVVSEGKVRFVESDGGLVSALTSYLEKQQEKEFTETIWVGAGDFSEKSWDKFRAATSSKTSYIIEPLFIDEKVFNKFYNGFCNATIWPLFHYFPSFADFDDATFASYEVVNGLFRDKIVRIARPDDTIWIHDYHLLLLPGMLRQELPSAAIGMFLHIPFPSFDVFRLLHSEWKHKIVNGMLGADVIGFHTHEYVQHFLKTMRMISGYDHRYREIHTGTRLVNVNAYPLGIDFAKFNSTSSNHNVRERKLQIRRNLGESRIIFSVDRLDYTKGVTHRLSGFEKFLEKHAHWRGKVTFVMVVVPSRQIVSKYNERRKLIEEQVGRINGKYSTLEWQPIIYRYANLGFEELSALYQVSDIALITPLRDGMNLVAKEYVASREDQSGVLILSELAGAAAELGEAMLVNPTDTHEVASAIFNALQCPLPDQKRRMAQMQETLKNRDVSVWVRKFLGDLNLTRKRQAESLVSIADSDTVSMFIKQFQESRSKLLLLDYDGTLAPISLHPDDAAPDDALTDLLRRLSEVKNLELVIISGRDCTTMDNWFNDLRAHLVAEHGAAFRISGGHWEHKMEVDPDWKEIVNATFESFHAVSPGSLVERKRHTIAWHYRQMDTKQGFMRSRELLDSLHHLIRNSNVTVLDGQKVIEVRAPGIDKGIAALKMLQSFPSDFVLAIGDDKTDEDVFKALGKQAITVKVGEGITCAQYRVSEQADVIALLHGLINSQDEQSPRADVHSSIKTLGIK